MLAPFAPKRRWFQWSLRTLFEVVTVSACFLGWMALGPWIEYQIWSRPVPGWQGKTVDLHCEYFGPDKMERLGMDLFPTDPFPKCLLISAMAVRGGSAHRLRVMLRLDRMVWPVSLLAAFFSWKIGRAIVARLRGRNESATQPLDFMQTVVDRRPH